MMRLNQEQLKSIHALQREPSFYKLTQLIEEEFEIAIKGLMTASTTKVQPLQGRAKLLEELLSIFKHTN